jgi:hypothetical protein
MPISLTACAGLEQRPNEHMRQAKYTVGNVMIPYEQLLKDS